MRANESAPSAEGRSLRARGGRLLERHHLGSELWRQDDTFVLLMRGRFTADALADAIRTMYAHADPPSAVLFVEGTDLVSYDRSVLTFYERDEPRAMPRRIGVVIQRPLFRMVVRATALGFGLATGRKLEVFESLEPALDTW